MVKRYYGGVVPAPSLLTEDDYCLINVAKDLPEGAFLRWGEQSKGTNHQTDH